MTAFEIYRQNNQLFKELVKEFGPDAKEIIGRIMCGESVDAAIQSIICEED